MYKKFLVSMLLTAVLAGCNHQPSDKQGDQSDTAMPVQDQMVNPASSPSSDESMSMPVTPQAQESNQMPLSGATTPATPATPGTGTDSSGATHTMTPAEPTNKDK